MFIHVFEDTNWFLIGTDIEEALVEGHGTALELFVGAGAPLNNNTIAISVPSGTPFLVPGVSMLGGGVWVRSTRAIGSLVYMTASRGNQGNQMPNGGNNWNGADGTTPPNGWVSTGTGTIFIIEGSGLHIECQNGGYTYTTVTVPASKVGKRYTFYADIRHNHTAMPNFIIAGVDDIRVKEGKGKSEGLMKIEFDAPAETFRIGFESADVPNGIFTMNNLKLIDKNDE